MVRGQTRAPAPAGVPPVREPPGLLLRVGRSKQPSLQRGIQPLVEHQTGSRAVRPARLVVIRRVLHRPHPPSHQRHCAVLPVHGVVHLFARERPAQLELPQRPLPVGYAREDGEEEVPLHRHRHVLVRSLITRVRQGRALPSEPLDESEVVGPVQPLRILIRGVLTFGRQRDVTPLHPHELHHHGLFHRRAVLVRLRAVQPLGEGDQAPKLKRLGGRQHAPLLVEPLEVFNRQRGTLGVGAREHVPQGQVRRGVRRVGLEEGGIRGRRRSVPPAELAPAVPAE
mmetsp:Transcript_7258/g.32716  ORF Transcript_7258/g.32716 Transcript_7258/m.32716 type:complete len:283 (+) Transcript_7258:1277-2125(+)